MSDNTDDLLAQIEELKKRVRSNEQKDTAPVQKRTIRIKRPATPQQVEEEVIIEEQDPVAMYQQQHGQPQQQQQGVKQDLTKVKQLQQDTGDMIDKRVAAQDTVHWLKLASAMGFMAIISVFMIYLFIIAGLAIVSDGVLVFTVIGEGYLLIKVRKYQLYLQNKYRIQTKPLFNMPINQIGRQGGQQW